MILHTLETKQFINSDINSIWDFISSPTNLKVITPEYMNFTVVNELSINKKMYPGQIIQYHVSPIFGIPLNWVTEITHVEDKSYFVDEQRFGLYTFWHHQHFIKEVNGGVEMIDIVHYKLPFGIFGKLLNTLYLKKQLKQIFEYRFNKVETLFS